jgi:hypothetical protein
MDPQRPHGPRSPLAATITRRGTILLPLALGQ